MSFGGQSSAEKARSADIEKTGAQVKDISTGAEAKGNKAFRWFKQAATPAADYWKGILGDDRTAIDEFLGPELSRITSAFGGERKVLSEFSPRGGARASGITDLATKEASLKGDAILKARPAAADALERLAGLFSGTSQGFTGQALSGLGESADIGFNLNKEQEAIRQRRAQMFAALGEAVGSIVGEFATGGASLAGGATKKTSSGVANTSPFGKG